MIPSIFSNLSEAKDVGMGLSLVKVQNSTYCGYHCQISVPICIWSLVQTALGTLQHNGILNWISRAIVVIQFGAAVGKSDENIEG